MRTKTHNPWGTGRKIKGIPVCKYKDVCNEKSSKHYENCWLEFDFKKKICTERHTFRIMNGEEENGRIV